MADLTEREKKLAETLRNPVLWGQSYLFNRDGKPRGYWDHQKDDLLSTDRNIVHLDGRDCGKCHRADTLITDCNTGERIRIDQLQPGKTISALGPDQKIHLTSDYSILPNGKKPCWRLRTRTGRTISSTGNHPFLTDRGWLPLESFKPGDWIAVPSTLPTNVAENTGISDAELKLLAYLIADGGFGHSTVAFTKKDTIIVDEFKACVKETFPTVRIVNFAGIAYRLSKSFDETKNPVATWLRSHGLMGKTSAYKRIPPIIFSCSILQQAVFLSRLFACDGWFHVKKDAGAEIGYCSASYELAEGLVHLLLRFGIFSSLRERIVNSVSYWTVDIRSWDGVRRYIRLIGMSGIKGVMLDEMLESAQKMQ